MLKLKIGTTLVVFMNQNLNQPLSLKQKRKILHKIKQITKKLNVTVAAEVYPFLKFWRGEDYHQNYERLHPNNSYVRNISIPRLRKFQRKFKYLLK